MLRLFSIYAIKLIVRPRRFVVPATDYRQQLSRDFAMDMSKERVAQFHERGYVVLENFLSKDEVEALKSACGRLVDAMDPSQHRSVFSVGSKHISDEYFISSGDKIRYFFEEGALDERGNLTVEKHVSLNKIGHALHWLDPSFKKISFSGRVKDLFRALDYVDPVIVQSMYIFKNPQIGGEVVPHQDATFLHTVPPKLVGLWFPLEDATLENGCLWFVPGSHHREITSRFIRNPRPEGPRLVFTGQKQIQVGGDEFVAVPAPKGSCVVIHGQVVHKSEKNTSSKCRPAYTFHVIDQHGTHYSKDNWLQPTESLPFPSVYQTQV